MLAFDRLAHVVPGSRTYRLDRMRSVSFCRDSEAVWMSLGSRQAAERSPTKLHVYDDVVADGEGADAAAVAGGDDYDAHDDRSERPCNLPAIVPGDR